MHTYLSSLKNLIKSFEGYAHLAEPATCFLDKKTPTTIREPYASLIHFDLWSANVMNKLENNKIVKNIFIDFQIYDYRSPAADVFFFLWTSVQKQVLEHHIDDLTLHYHNQLLKTVESYQIDISQFTYQTFEEELRVEAGFEFGHAALFAFGLKMETKEPWNSEKTFYEIEDLGTTLKDYFYFMVTECNKRGWLY